MNKDNLVENINNEDIVFYILEEKEYFVYLDWLKKTIIEKEIEFNLLELKPKK